MLTTLHDLKTFFRENWQKGLEYFLASLLLIQFAGFVSVFSIQTDPRSMIQGRDADGAHIVGTAERTRWYLDNGEAPYGAVYYRIAHTFAEIAGRKFIGPESDTEKSERAHHLALMVFALMSVFASSWLLAGLVLRTRTEQMIWTGCLVALLLYNPVWARFVYRPHPDMVFGFVILTAVLLTIKMFQNPDNRLWFGLSGILWGLSGMFKLTMVVFLPALVILWVPPFKIEQVKRAAAYYLWALFGFVFLGLPQSLNFPRYIRFLFVQNAYGIGATRESVTFWFSQLYEQTSWPLLATLAIASVGYAFDRSRIPWVRMALIILVPTAYLFSYQSNYETDYYLFPIVLSILALVAMALAGRVPVTQKVRQAVLLSVAGAIWWNIGFVPETMEKELGPYLSCRTESVEIYRKIHEEVDNGRIFVIDPYIAFDRSRTKDRAFGGWQNDWSVVKSRSATAVAVNLEYAKFIIGPADPPHDVQMDAPNWRDMRTYLKQFSESSNGEVRDPDNHIWRRSLSTPNCHFEVWLRD